MSSLYVAGLVLLLGSPDFNQREAANRELTKIVSTHPFTYGPHVAPWIPAAARGTQPGSREKLRYLDRINRIYRSYLATHYIPEGVPVWPICDCWTWKIFGATIRDRDFIRVGPVNASDYGNPLPSWRSYREATERQFRHWIYDGMEPKEANRWIQLMWASEKRYESDRKDIRILGVLLEAEKGGWIGYFPETPRIPEPLPLETEEPCPQQP